ncbi:thioesterase family protein, partial [Dietzia sp.]|uniref:thioesterase family protein n=1 Tax=Dietzia sp. TaxID=1871616 RepID=UPI002FDB9002
GAWNEEEQHISPLLGLLAKIVEDDCAERDAAAGTDRGLVLARLDFEILGTVAITPFEVRTEIVRPGRTIELVQAVASQDGRDAVILRAWLLKPIDSSAVAGHAFPPIPAREDMEEFDPRGLWPGGFIDSIAEGRVRAIEPGHAQVWARTDVELVEGEAQSDATGFVGMFDLANGLSARAAREEVLFPNVDLTAHLFRQPRGKWVGYEVRQNFGAEGIGLTETVLYDDDGPIGTMSQILTVRPR